MLELIISLPSKIYNIFLALFMSSLTIYFFIHSVDIAKDNALDESKVELYIVSSGVVVFFFLSRFESVFGKFLRVLAYLVIAAFVLYLTIDMQDKTFQMIIRGIVAFVVLFGLYGFISFVYEKNKMEDLMKNGWKIDAVFKDVDFHSAEDSSWYVMKMTGRSPATGEELTFLSEALFFNPTDKIKEEQTFTVYVDKKNPKKYSFKDGEFSNL